MRKICVQASSGRISQSGLRKIYYCDNWISRLRGIFFRPVFGPQYAVFLTKTSAVHSIGLCKPLDIVFLDADRTIQSIQVLRPYSYCSCKTATSVLELARGGVENLGLTVGDKIEFGRLLERKKFENRNIRPLLPKQRGASMVEFLFVAPVIIFIGLGIIQMGLAYQARNVLDYATFEAARSGAVNQADKQAMRQELAYRLGPIFSGNGSSESIRDSVGRAVIAINDPLRTQLRIINPTSAVFDDFGVSDSVTGETVLPNSHLQYRSTEVGAQSGLSIQDANLLKIEVTHGYELKLPWFEMTLPGVDFALRELMVRVNPANSAFYLRGQIPLRTVATVRMQSEATANNVAAPDAGTSRPDTEFADSENSGVPASDISGNESTDGNEECVGSHGLPADITIDSIADNESVAQCSIAWNTEIQASSFENTNSQVRDTEC